MEFVNGVIYFDDGTNWTALKGGEQASPSSYTAISNLYSVDAGFRVVYQINDETAEIEFPIEGTDDIIVDIDEPNSKINVHIDAEVRSKLAKMLLLPNEAVSSVELVGVGTNNAQVNLSPSEVRTTLETKRVLTMTQSEYDAITTKDSETLYCIIEG